MIWAYSGRAAKISVCFVDGRMKSNGYREVLRNRLVDIENSIGVQINKSDRI